MSDHYERTLQISFGIVGALSTIITMASLHYRDSLGCILFRRWLLNQHQSMSQSLSSIDGPVLTPPQFRILSSTL